MKSYASTAKIHQLVEALRPYRPECVFLFGSWAREQADELSDVDLVVITHASALFFDRLREARGLLPVEVGGADL
jgi:predicted nucleotidyltransferase